MSLLMKYWHFDPVFVEFMAVLFLGYLYLSDRKFKARAGYFITALLLIIICTCSPLHWLAENYLFSAHMTAHIILFFIVGPLLVFSIPEAPPREAAQALMSISRRLASIPWMAWLLGVGVMWFWHIPAVFDAGFHMSGLLHYTESISLVLIGIIFCWPVIGPFAGCRIQPLKGVIYLFTACIFCSLLGVLITFAPLGIYQHYLIASGNDGFSSFIRNDWGITPAADQQMAGLIMWVPGCLIYLIGSVYLSKKWFTEKEEQQEPLTFETKNI